MIGRALVLCCCSLAAADVTYFGCVATPGQATDKSGLKGEAASGVAADVLGAHGSGIAWTGTGQKYLMVADRGPSDGDGTFRCRWQTMELGIEDDGLPSVMPKCLATTLLEDDKGRPFVGTPGGFKEGTRLDPEAIRVGPDGTVYLADEYGPSILAFSPEGKLLKRLPVPEKFLCAHAADTKEGELPPANTSGRVPNHGFEGLAITPAGDKLYAILQGPLIQDSALDESNKGVGLNVRVLELPLTGGGATREFLYQLDGPKFGVSEMVAVNDHEFLVIERDDAEGEQAKFKKVMKIDIAGASDVSGIASLPRTGTPEGVKPVAKTVAVDLLNPKYGINDERMPAKIEGLAFGPDLKDGTHVLIVTSDNDAKVSEPTWYWVFGLDAKSLPGFQAVKPGGR